MNSILDTALIIGIILNFSKGADLLLLEAQKKKLQNRFENFAIFIDDVRPINWLDKLKTKKAQKILLIGSILFVVLFFAFRVYNDFDIKAEFKPKTFAEKIFTNPIFILVVWLISIPFLSNLGVRINRWMIKDRKILKFFLRLIFYILCTWVVFLMIRSFFDLLNSVVEESQTGNTGISFAITVLLFSPFILLIYANLLVYWLIIVTTVIQIILNILLKLLREITWRIVEYNRGVYPALILIATIILGIVELKIKYGR